MRRIILRFFTLILAATLSAQVPPVRVYQLQDWVSYKNSLYPTSLTNGIEYVYFGTSGGVIPWHKYGRYWCPPFTTSNGMSGDFVTAVLFDQSTNYLWAAHGNGLSYLTPTENTWNNVSKSSLNLPAAEPIIRLGSDPDKLWGQTADGHFFTVNKVLGFYLASQTTTVPGIRWEPCSYDPLPEIPNYAIDRDYHYDPRRVFIDSNLRDFPIVLFHVDASRDVYGGAWGLGLMEGDDNIRKMRLFRAGPLQNCINALVRGNAMLWMGGAFLDPNPLFKPAGISAFDPNSNEWSYYEDELIPELATGTINDLAFGDGRLWIATTQGLTIFETRKNRWKRLSMHNGLNDEIVTSVALEDSVAWIGTPRGFCTVSIPSYKVKRQKFYSSQNILKIYKIYADDHRIWFGTDNGLYAVDKLSRIGEHYDMNGQKIGLAETAVTEFTTIGASDSLTVFGHYQGLLIYDRKNQRWQTIAASGRFDESQLYDIALNKNYMWLGTSNGAILIRLNDYYQELYTTTDGLAGSAVFKILIDGQDVWFGTDRGLTKYKWGKYAFQTKN